MPKIRDLGINTVPLTMQPPAIGDGGGGGSEDWTGNAGCPPAGDAWTGNAGCPPAGDAWTGNAAGCPPAGDAWTGNAGGCPPAGDAWTGNAGCPPPGNKRTMPAGFNPESIAQVRQQIADQSATF
jgi:hypothetical protein